MRSVIRSYGLLFAWAAVIIVFSALRPSTFATYENVRVILGSQAVLVVLAMALIVPFTVGEFDLSIGGVLSVSLVLVGWLNVVQHWPIIFAIGGALAVGLAVGLLHSLLIVYIGIDSIVVTLGTGTLLIGAGIGINNVTTGGVAPALVNIVQFPILGIPAAFYYVLALTACLWYVLTFTPLGRYMYFIGAGRDVARLAGVRVDAIRSGSLVACSVLSAAAGVLLSGWIGAADPNVGAGFLLPAFAAVFLGATTIVPGRFNAWGTFAAVYFLVTGVTGLELIGLSGWVNQVFYGGALVVAVTFSFLAGGGRRSN